MTSQPPHTNAVRDLWLRRSFAPSNPFGHGKAHAQSLNSMGNAAARETLVSAAPHMSALWTGLFQDLLSPVSELRWLEDGPGLGRDARIAYSSLLGRYLARAFLTASEGVYVLVPVDVAQRYLRTTPYSIQKVPTGNRGLQADWIGLDTAGRLVIAEAKGTYDRGKGTWHGPSRPRLLQTAEKQAERTVVHAAHGRTLPARRWAVVSRWGTEHNQLDPTVLASCDDGPPLSGPDYTALAHALLDADRRAVLSGLGHADLAARLPTDFRPRPRMPGDISLRVRGIDLPPGAAALAGPSGFRPLRNADDLTNARDLFVDSEVPQIAVASFSSRHATTLPEPARDQPDAADFGVDNINDGAEFAGLSVDWPLEPTDVVFRDA